MIIKTDKKDLRMKALNDRKSLPASLQQTYSNAIFDKLLSLPAYTKAKEVMVYLDFNNEVSTDKIVTNIIERNHHLYIPVTVPRNCMIIPSLIKDKSHLRVSNFGILETPIEMASSTHNSLIDLVIIPGLVFDETGNRIGFGKGYYDNFLGSLNRKVTTIALAYDFQVKDSIPSEPHDFKMDYIITPSRIISTL